MYEFMPEYKCHKVVRAAPIVYMNFVTGVVRVSLPSGRQENILVSKDFFGRVKVDGGPGYLVVYEDGFISWSPAKAFEEGYTIKDKT